MTPDPSVIVRRAFSQGTYYIFLATPLQDMVRSYGDRMVRVDTGDPASALVGVGDAARYATFRKNLATSSLSTSLNNYIYRVNRPVLLFDGSERDCVRVFRSCRVDAKARRRYWFGVRGSGILETGSDIQCARFIAANVSKLTTDGLDRCLGVTTEDFCAVFDGVHLPGHLPAVFLPVALESTLVDGSAMRTRSIGAVPPQPDFDFPDWVFAEVTRYTDAANRKMDPKVISWLKMNAPKSYATKRVYRGFGFDFNGASLSSVTSDLRQMSGYMSFSDVGIGTAFTIRRGKESSWSSSPMAARNFISGRSAHDIDFLVKATFPSLGSSSISGSSRLP